MQIHLTTATLLLITASAIGQEGSTDRLPLLHDTRFERGFTVWSSKPGAHVKLRLDCWLRPRTIIFNSQ